jgi:hypothetical protein
MVLRALTSLEADLARGSLFGEESAMSGVSENDTRSPARSAEPGIMGDELIEAERPGAKREAKEEKPEEKQSPRKGRPKKGGSLDSWPEAGDEEEVETFNLGKKS